MQLSLNSLSLQVSAFTLARNPERRAAFGVLGHANSMLSVECGRTAICDDTSILDIHLSQM